MGRTSDRIFCAIFLFIPCVPFLLSSESLNLSVRAEHALLMNADTGVILYEKKAHERCYPASTTKIATVSYALQQIGNHLDRELTAEQDDIGSVSVEAKQRSNYSLPAHWLEPGATHIGINKGETLPLEALLYATMLASADDASNMIARFVGGSIPKFMDQLNAYIEHLGCQETHFTNPHGLFHPQHYTTAFDLARITQEALKDPQFRTLVATTKYQRPRTNKQDPSPMIQGNRLLRQGKHYYSKAIGVKTGYIAAAGHCLVAAATDPKDQRTLIAVLLKAKERDQVFQDAIALFEAAFNQPKLRHVFLHAGPQKWRLPLPGKKRGVATQLKEDLSIDYYPAEKPKVRCFFQPYAIQYLVEEEDVVGVIALVDERGETVKSVSVYPHREEKEGIFWPLIGMVFNKVVGIVALIALLALYWIFRSG